MRVIDLTGSGGKTRKITRAFQVPTSAGAVATLPIGRLASPVSAVKTSGNADLTIPVAATGVISSAAGIGAGVSEQIVGSMTGADGCVITFDYTLTGQSSVPGAPTLVPTSGDTQITIDYTDGAANGSAITGRNLYRDIVSGFTPGPSNLIASPSSTNYVDTGLTNGVTYYYRGSDVNGIGEGAFSAEVNAVPSSASNDSQLVVTVI